jgi:hypothetical protein
LLDAAQGFRRLDQLTVSARRVLLGSSAATKYEVTVAIKNDERSDGHRCASAAMMRK